MIGYFTKQSFTCVFLPVKTYLKMAENASESGNILTTVLSEIIESPLNIALVILIAVLVYKIVKSRTYVPSASAPEPKLPKLKKRDFTVQELNKFDGTQDDGRILIAVNGNVYDVTKGKRFYGPGGPYAAFGGKDASRGLATFSVSVKTEEYDDLSDLNSIEMDSVREWEAQFKEKYELVGKLLKPGEEPTNYSDEEDESSAATTAGGAGDRSKED